MASEVDRRRAAADIAALLRTSGYGNKLEHYRAFLYATGIRITLRQFSNHF